jgi:hypothetical protein
MYLFSTLSRERQQELHDAYLAELPMLLSRFEQRYSASGRTSLTQLDDLIGMDEWLQDEMQQPQDPRGKLPVWWDPTVRTSDDGGNPRLPTRAQLSVIDDAGAALAHVMRLLKPEAEWTIYRAKKEVFEGESVLRVGKRGYRMSPRGATYGVGLRVNGNRWEPGKLRHGVELWLEAN